MKSSSFSHILILRSEVGKAAIGNQNLHGGSGLSSNPYGIFTPIRVKNNGHYKQFPLRN